MSALQDFIDNARKKNFSDDEIKQRLLSEGWDEAKVSAALHDDAATNRLGDLEVPRPEVDSSEAQPLPPASSKIEKASKTSIHPLHAAILHVLLWFFIASSSVSIWSVFSVFFNEGYSDEGSLTTLSRMIAVVLVTFIPYAIFYYLYVKKLRSNVTLVPSTIWSTITICFHSIAAMIAAITIVIQIIGGSNMAVLCSAALILIIDAIVIATFAFAAFVNPTSPLRKTVIIFSPLALTLIMTLLFVFSLVNLPNIKADVEMRKSMANGAIEVREYAMRNQSLPTSSSQLELDEGVTYEKTTDSQYKICGTFKQSAKNASRYPYERNQPISDSYVYEDSPSYVTADSEEPCTEFTSEELRYRQRTDAQSEKEQLQVQQLPL